MADRTSAAIFSDVFTLLAGGGPLDRAALARWFWERSGRYDFCPQQMECNEALAKLGLARRGVDPEFPNDGETWLYGPACGPPDEARRRLGLALARILPGAPVYIFDTADDIALGDRVVVCGPSRVRRRVGHEPSHGVAVRAAEGGRVQVCLVPVCLVPEEDDA